MITDRARAALRPARPRRDPRGRPRRPRPLRPGDGSARTHATLVADLPGGSARLTAGSQGVAPRVRERRGDRHRQRGRPARRRARCCAPAATPRPSPPAERRPGGSRPRCLRWLVRHLGGAPMKRNVWLAAASLVGALALAACGSSGGSKSDSGAEHDVDHEARPRRRRRPRRARRPRCSSSTPRSAR